MSAGASTSAAGGDVLLTGGTGHSKAGAVVIQGASSTSGRIPGGVVELKSGAAIKNEGESGLLLLHTASNVSKSGAVVVSSGSSTGPSTGSIKIGSGTSSKGRSGDAFLYSSDGDSSGSITIR